MARSVRWLPCVLLLLCGRLAFAETKSATADFAASTRDYLQRLERLGFAGSVVVVVDGQPLFAEGFGLADRERNVPWTPATVSCVGSITKQFTAAAILQLAEAGKVKVEDRIETYFDGVPADKRGITLHQLLTHSSGIVDLEGADDYDPIDRDEFVRRVLAPPLAFAPGSSYEYSNAGYSLLGAIIEKVAGTSYEQYLRDHLFLPMGMYETGYILAPWGEGRMAQGYRDAERWGTVLGRSMAPDGPWWVLRANGAIHTTSWDMARWARALLDGRVLSPASRERLWTPYVRESADGDSSYGYGWSIQQRGGMKIVTHNGSNGIFYADLAIVPDEKAIVYLMTNVASGNRYTRRLLEQIGMHLMAKVPYPDVPRVAEANPEAMRAVEGEWVLAGGGRVRLSASPDALVAEPLDPAAFSALFGAAPQDAADRKRAEERSQRLLAAAKAIVRGDYAPLHALYGDSVTLERLTKIWSERRASFVERHGALQDATLAGAIRQEARHLIVVRFRFEHGEEAVTFFWDAAPDGQLLGISGAPRATRLRFFPEDRGGWASFDRTTGESKPLRRDGVHLLLGRGAEAVEATRRK